MARISKALESLGFNEVQIDVNAEARNEYDHPFIMFKTQYNSSIRFRYQRNRLDFSSYQSISSIDPQLRLGGEISRTRADLASGLIIDVGQHPYSAIYGGRLEDIAFSQIDLLTKLCRWLGGRMDFNEVRALLIESPHSIPIHQTFGWHNGLDRWRRQIDLVEGEVNMTRKWANTLEADLAYAAMVAHNAKERAVSESMRSAS